MMRMSFISTLTNIKSSSFAGGLLKNGGLAIATLATLGFGLTFPAVAQVGAEVDPLEDFQTQDGSGDILSGTSQQGIQDLIHQINLSGGLSMEEFSVQRQENIMSEADRFRELQRVRIDQEQGSVEDSFSDTAIDGIGE